MFFFYLVCTADVGIGGHSHLSSGTEVSSGLSQPLLVREDDLEGQVMRKITKLHFAAMASGDPTQECRCPFCICISPEHVTPFFKSVWCHCPSVGAAHTKPFLSRGVVQVKAVLQ